MKRYVDFLEKVKQYCYERIIIWGGRSKWEADKETAGSSRN